MTSDRHVYEVEFKPKKVDGGLSLTLKGVVLHMEAASCKEAEEQAWTAAKVFLRPEVHDWFELCHCQAIGKADA